MKKIALLMALLAISLCAESIEKKGFLTSKWCAQNGYFADCRLESLVCGSGECFKKWEFGDTVTDELVLFVHNEQKIYAIDCGSIPRYKLDEPMNMNEVTIMGELRGDTIIASGFQAPPPPQKSFFKGCL